MISQSTNDACIYKVLDYIKHNTDTRNPPLPK